MRMRFYVTVAIAAALILSGCANQIGRYDGGDAGYAVLTFAAQKGAPYHSYGFSIRTRDRKQTAYMVWITDGILFSKKPDADYGSQAILVDIAKLPPGDYEIYDFSVSQGSYPAEVHYSAKTEFSIPFSVHAGEAVYLGEYLAVATSGKNFFGITVPGPPYFVVSDQHARDLGYARGKEPGIADLHAAVPNADTLGLVFLRSKPL